MQLSRNLDPIVIKQLNFVRIADGGQDWTRTSDPRLIKAVL